jgi:NAD(P)-dependent dehydrogenase (short-subunit alcohol dehydrogenase family)
VINSRFQGKVVIVTGAGTGIGAATARRFHAEGAAVPYVREGFPLLDNLKAKPAMLTGGMKDRAIAPDVQIADFREVCPDRSIVKLPEAGRCQSGRCKRDHRVLDPGICSKHLKERRIPRAGPEQTLAHLELKANDSRHRTL